MIKLNLILGLKRNWVRRNLPKKEYAKKWRNDNRCKLNAQLRERYQKKRNHILAVAKISRDARLLKKKRAQLQYRIDKQWSLIQATVRWLSTKRAKAHAYYKANKEELLKHQRETYYPLNKSKKIQQSREWRRRNRQSARRIAREWARQNPESAKRWLRKNPEKRRSIARKHSAKVLSTPKGKLNHRMSTALNVALRGKKSGRGWESLVGYTMEDLALHIESLFSPGMNWDRFNKGQIQIDHRIPKSKFHYRDSSDPEFRKCWALENLRPMWKTANLSKGCRMDEHSQIPLGI